MLTSIIIVIASKYKDFDFVMLLPECLQGAH